LALNAFFKAVEPPEAAAEAEAVAVLEAVLPAVLVLPVAHPAAALAAAAAAAAPFKNSRRDEAARFIDSFSGCDINNALLCVELVSR
jgi:hypothetical protein